MELKHETNSEYKCASLITIMMIIYVFECLLVD